MITLAAISGAVVYLAVSVRAAKVLGRVMAQRNKQVPREVER